MTPLGRKLAQHIATSGPLTVADFMAACLADREHGYYTRRDPLGAAGDFITAPEISQMFGELLGLWAAQVWDAMGRPAPVIFAELGPGRGTLMADALRAIGKAAPDFAGALRLHLVEINAALRERQAIALSGAAPVWHHRYEDVPAGPLLLMANEFVDALPVRQFVREGRVWRERMVRLDSAKERFVFASGPETTLPLRDDAPEGAFCEVRPAADDLAAWLAQRVCRHGGAALLVDYGSAASGLGDTLQAVRHHRVADPLDDPGDVDLTAHVDFQALARAARRGGARADGPVPQETFLRRLGIDARAAVLLRQADKSQATKISEAYRTLIGAERMGRVFKALAIAAPSLSTLPGFDSEG
jgi:NADH dehydrogenase [ubiquinone] 1 alpha subcomplex assembly factor 7